VPLDAYYGGHGKRVAEQMKKRYGKRWRQVFYATANAKGQNPGDKKSSKRKALEQMRRGR
jgi:hypothetical protein